MKKQLTDRQQQIYAYIVSYIRSEGYSPAVRDICEEFGIKSTNGAVVHLNALEKKGYISRSSGKSRTIRLIGTDVNDSFSSEESVSGGIREIPILGRIAAGAPVVAHEEVESVLRVDGSLFAGEGEKLFALRVRGESMTGDGIMPGDLVFVRPQSSAREGELVTVMVDGDATVKRYRRDGDRIHLLSSNPLMEDIIVDLSHGCQFHILGVIRGVMRDYR